MRAHHGYVVAPGSYVVDEEKGYEGSYIVEIDAPVQDASPALLARLSAPRERQHNASDPLVEPDMPDAVALAWAYLATDAPLAIEGQGGDATTYKVACIVRGFGLSEETALEFIGGHIQPAMCSAMADGRSQAQGGERLSLRKGPSRR